jgi:hypothetical protein
VLKDIYALLLKPPRQINNDAVLCEFVIFPSIDINDAHIDSAAIYRETQKATGWRMGRIGPTKKAGKAPSA